MDEISIALGFCLCGSARCLDFSVREKRRGCPIFRVFCESACPELAERCSSPVCPRFSLQKTQELYRPRMNDIPFVPAFPSRLFGFRNKSYFLDEARPYDTKLVRRR